MDRLFKGKIEIISKKAFSEQSLVSQATRPVGIKRSCQVTGIHATKQLFEVLHEHVMNKA